MTGREKIEAAFSPGGTREFPAVICYEGIYIRDHWDQLTSCPWWYIYSPDLDHQLQWQRDAIRRTGQDWFVLPYCHSREERERLAIEDRPDGVFRVDRRTGERMKLERPGVAGWAADGRLHSFRPDRLADTQAEIDRLIAVPTDFDPQASVRAGCADLAALVREEVGRDLYPIRHVSSPLWQCYGLWGFEGMMTMVAERPDLVAHACRRLAARSICSVREAAAHGAAGIWIEECMTDMVSPAAFESLHLPHLRAIVDEIRAAGMRSVYYYCGDPTGKWDLLFDAGADALSLEESKKGFTIEIGEVVARAAGRCAVLGNLDAIGLLPNGTEAQLRAEIGRQLDAGRRGGGRFVMSLGSPVTPGTSVERVRLYCDIVHEMGKA